MSPIWLGPSAVSPAQVRRLPSTAETGRPVRRVVVPLVEAPSAVPRQIDPVGQRLKALQLENEQLRAELTQLRSA